MIERHSLVSRRTLWWLLAAASLPWVTVATLLMWEATA